jgi:hypothetical protein
MSWAEDELKNTRFRRSPPRTTPVNDRRREQRLLTIVEDLIAQPNASVLQASRDDAAVQGLYKFWSNRRITPAAILSGHIAQTVERSLQTRHRTDDPRHHRIRLQHPPHHSRLRPD